MKRSKNGSIIQPAKSDRHYAIIRIRSEAASRIAVDEKM